MPPPKTLGKPEMSLFTNTVSIKKNGVRKQRTRFILPHLKVPVPGDFPPVQKGTEVAGAKPRGEPCHCSWGWALAPGTGKAAAETQQHLLLALGALQRLPTAGITECFGRGGAPNIVPSHHGQGHLL